jgi:flagellar biosynthesis/type III secretory pathway chaperone
MSDIGRILDFEENLLESLLSLLDLQHKAIIKNDIKTMETMVDELIEKGKEIEKAEEERKGLLGGISMKEALSKDKELDEKIRKIKRVFSEIDVQKKTNVLLLRQGTNFNEKVISILSQKRNSKVYGNNGKLI